GIGRAEPEAELRFVEHQIAACGDRRAGRDDVRVRVVVVLEDVAAEISGRGTGVIELDPVARYSTTRFDFINAHKDGAIVRGALRDNGGSLECAGAIGTAAVGRDGVRRPHVRVNEGCPAGRVEARGVARAEAEAEVRFFYDVKPVRGDRRGRRQ